MNEQELREKILNELREEYQLIPKNAKQFSVNDILKKYEIQIANKAHIENNYSNRQSINHALRKIICIKNGVFVLKDIPVQLREKAREDLEKLILEILKEE